jgi:phosphocarrier protein
MYKEDSEANVKSILSVLGACIRCGDEIEMICDGVDEVEAMAELRKLIEEDL